MRNARLMLAHLARNRHARLSPAMHGAHAFRRVLVSGTDACPTLPPADAEPAALAAERLYGRKPDGLWRYATAGDETAFFAVRWNKAGGRKTFRPVSWLDSGGWQMKAWPNHRPLFNLPALSRHPTASIVICEGERAAQAAAAVFPESIATTSSGGAGAASRSDWTPLAGRAVSIWPDFDAAGEKYAREVASELASLGCSTSIVDVRALASIDPGGGVREPIATWDAADAIAEWRDLKALRNAAIELSEPFDANRIFPFRAD